MEIFLFLFSPGYRHVYLEGLTEASIFVHIIINETYGKVGTAGNLHLPSDKNGFRCSPEPPRICVPRRLRVWGVSLQKIRKEPPPFHDSTLAVHILADVLTVST